MEFKKCNRCGNFYVSNGLVCPKCEPKDNFEFSTFKSYIKENGLNASADAISGATGISVKNVNRFIEYNKENNGGAQGLESEKGINGITFLI